MLWQTVIWSNASAESLLVKCLCRKSFGQMPWLKVIWLNALDESHLVNAFAESHLTK
jgi:hypothetical protein